MNIKAEIMDENAIGRTLLRLAHEVVEKHRGIKDLVIVGIRNRGDCLAKRIIQTIKEMEGEEPPLGILDITLYRDDFQSLSEAAVVQDTEINFDITNKKVILVDDVLYTGRTIRAALDAIIDFGRPACIQLAVLIDRGHRELPIKADFVGKNVPTSVNEQIKVHVNEVDGEDKVLLVEI